MKKLLFLFMASVAALSSAEDSSTSVPSTVATVPAIASESKIIGGADLRPSYDLGTSQTRLENTFELGYQFNKNTSASYVQDVYANIDDKSGMTFMKGWAEKGFLRAKLKNILVDEENGISLSYEPRFYVPVRASDRDNGQITTMRNYLILAKKISPAVTLLLIENPMFHAYNRAGVYQGPKAVANPVFENRVYLEADISLLDGKVNVALPIEMHNTRNREFDASAKFNNAWHHFIGIYPEVTYSLTPNIAIGAAYYSDNFLPNGDFSDFSFDSGYNKGAYQAILKASL